MDVGSNAGVERTVLNAAMAMTVTRCCGTISKGDTLITWTGSILARTKTILVSCKCDCDAKPCRCSLV